MASRSADRGAKGLPPPGDWGRRFPEISRERGAVPKPLGASRLPPPPGQAPPGGGRHPIRPKFPILVSTTGPCLAPAWPAVFLKCISKKRSLPGGRTRARCSPLIREPRWDLGTTEGGGNDVRGAKRASGLFLAPTPQLAARSSLQKATKQQKQKAPSQTPRSLWPVARSTLSTSVCTLTNAAPGPVLKKREKGSAV